MDVPNIQLVELGNLSIGTHGLNVGLNNTP